MKKSIELQIELQIELFKNVLNLERMTAYDLLDDGRIAFTKDGFSAFAIPQHQCFIDLTKIRKLEILKSIFLLTDEDKPVKLTKIEANTSHGQLVKLKSDTFDVWCKKAFFLKYYGDQDIYCSGSCGAIKFLNNISGKVEAFILPFRVNDLELE